jgi:serine phosphatase RsbU (regulator of sigma subunit)
LSLLPRHDLQIAGFEVTGFSDAARSVGGDYFDFIPLAGGRCLIIIGDVSGKGISAALYMAKVQTLLHIFAKQTGDLRELLVRLNEHLLRELKRNYFLTLAIVGLGSNGGVQLCRAGHTPVLLFERQRGDCSWIKPKGIAIGLAVNHREPPDAQNGVFQENLEVIERTLAGGDIVLLFTDGVSETLNPARQEFGEERLQRILLRHHHASPETIKQALLRELAGFRRGAELQDDTSFVIIKREQDNLVTEKA